ncbi:MAG: hypothetical protein H7067_16000 [Burkholderiales bacterium]|nr:hypothetical protein [Opitutaceae bacterium]
MTTAGRRILYATTALFLLVIGLAGLVFAPFSTPAPTPRYAAAPAAEAPLLTATQAETFAFFNEGRAAAANGRGLFETDFFKPAATPKPAPKPPAPTRREFVLFYRGFAAFPDGTRIAYLALEGRTVLLGEGGDVTDGWKLVSFDSDAAVLAKGEERVTLAFNRRATLSVPVPSK